MKAPLVRRTTAKYLCYADIFGSGNRGCNHQTGPYDVFVIMTALVRRFGHFSLALAQETGRAMLFLFEALVQAFLPPYRFRRLFQEIYFIGYKSLLIIFLTAAFAGMVMALQGYYTLRRYGSEGALGSVVALSLIREMGPVLTALMVSARAGCAVTAEIGIMRITEQLDALDTMAVNPMQYVVMPKLLAGLIAVPLLTAIFDVVGILGGYLVGVLLLGVSSGSYFSGMTAECGFPGRQRRHRQVPGLRPHHHPGGLLQGLFHRTGRRGREPCHQPDRGRVRRPGPGLGLCAHLLFHVSHDQNS